MTPKNSSLDPAALFLLPEATVVVVVDVVGSSVVVVDVVGSRIAGEETLVGGGDGSCVGD